MDTITILVQYSEQHAKNNYTPERGFVTSERVEIAASTLTEEQREAIAALRVANHHYMGFPLRHYRLGETLNGFQCLIYSDTITWDFQPSHDDLLHVLVELHDEFKQIMEQIVEVNQ